MFQLYIGGQWMRKSEKF